MELNQLRIFDSVARHLNITSAAEELHMSQPGVSLHLKYLEQEFGAKLYKRGNRGIELTRRGENFLDAIRPVLTQVRKVELQFKQAKERAASSTLIIGGSNTLSATVLPTVISDFRKRHPDVQFVVVTNGSAKIEQAVANSEMEIGLITKPSHSPRCVYEPFQDHEAVAFVAPSHSLHGKTIGLEDLAHYPLVVKRGSTCVEEIRSRGYELNLAAQFDSVEAVKIAVSQGLGVGLLYGSRVDAEIDKGDLTMVDIPEMKKITSPSFIVYGRQERLSVVGESFLESLRRIRDLA